MKSIDIVVNFIIRFEKKPVTKTKKLLIYSLSSVRSGKTQISISIYISSEEWYSKLPRSVDSKDLKQFIDIKNFLRKSIKVLISVVLMYGVLIVNVGIDL